MTRLGIIGGIAVGIVLGAGLTLGSDDKHRRRMMRDSKRAFRKAGNYFENMF